MFDSATSGALSFERLRLVDRPWFPYLCTEVEHWQWETGGDGHFNFWAALSGEGYLSCDGRMYRLRPGMFFVFSPRQSISAAHHAGPRITRFSAHFRPVREGVEVGAVPEFPLPGRMVRSLSVFRRQVDAIMRVAVGRNDEALLEQLVYDLVAASCGAGAVLPDAALHPKIGDAVRLFRERPGSVRSMDTVAEHLAMSRPHFDREFSRQMGEPPKRFLIQCRMIHARRLLENSCLRIGEIAEKLGYGDIYFFSRQFKRVFGMAPTQYRKRATSA